MFRGFVALLFLSLATSSTPASETLRGRIVAVHDGDTLTLLDDNWLRHRIRLARIDAPEIVRGKGHHGQPFGWQSKKSLSELVYGREILADCEKRDQYGRQVCTIWMGRTNVNLEQVRRGMAWVYRKHADDPTYVRAEHDAMSAKRGLWNDRNPTPPWEYRKAGSE